MLSLFLSLPAILNLLDIVITFSESKGSKVSTINLNYSQHVFLIYVSSLGSICSSTHHWASLYCLLNGKKEQILFITSEKYVSQNSLTYQLTAQTLGNIQLNFIPRVLCLVLVIEENITSSGPEASL